MLWRMRAKLAMWLMDMAGKADPQVVVRMAREITKREIRRDQQRKA